MNRNSIDIVKHKTILCIIILIPFFHTHLFGSSGQLEKNCAFHCLLRLCQLHDVIVPDMKELSQIMAPEKGLVSLYDLEGGLNLAGFGTLGMRLSYEELLSIEKMGIAQVQNSHFVLLTEATQRGVQIYDYPKEYFLKKADFKRTWSGVFLVVDPLQRHANIKLLEPVLDLGKIGGGESREFSIPLTNTGSQPFYIYNIQADCSCTFLSAYQLELKPGETKKILGRYDSGRQYGIDVSQIKFQSTDPLLPYANVPIRALIIRDIEIVPPWLSFGEIPAGGIAQIPFSLYVFQSKGFRIKNITTNVEGLKIIRGKKKKTDPYIKHPFIAEFKTNNEIQEVSGRIVIETTLATKPQIKISVKAKICSVWSLTPAGMLFRLTERNTKEIIAKEIKITHRGKQPFQITKVTFDNVSLHFDTLLSPNHYSHTINIKFKKELFSAENTHKHSLTINTTVKKAHSSIDVPLSVINY